MVPWQLFLTAVSQAGKGRGKFMGKQRALQDYEGPAMSWAGNEVDLQMKQHWGPHGSDWWQKRHTAPSQIRLSSAVLPAVPVLATATGSGDEVIP